MTSHDTKLQIEYRGKQTEFVHLSREYEERYAKWEQTPITDRSPGLPRACSVIAAKVKMLLSDPALARTTVEVAG